MSLTIRPRAGSVISEVPFPALLLPDSVTSENMVRNVKCKDARKAQSAR